MHPVASRDQSCSIWFINFFRSNEACDEAIDHVLGSVFGYLILLDDNDCVGAGVASGHALGESADLVSIQVGPCWLRVGVGNEVLVFKELASFPNNRVGHFTEPRHWEAAH